MTISSTSRKAGPFLGNGVAVSFPFAFKVFKKSDVRVTLTDPSGGDISLVLDSSYTVTLNVDQDSNPGGTVTYPVGGSPMATGFRLTITGALPNTQPTDIQNNGGFYPQVVEDMSDRSTIQIQQLQEQVDRTLKFSVSDPGTGAVLPPADLRANKVLGFDASGIPTALVPASGSAAEVALALASFTNSLANTTDTLKGVALVGGAGRVVPTVDDMRNQRAVRNPYVTAMGYYTPRDMPATTFAYDPADITTPDNGGSIRVSIYGERYKLPPNLTVNVNTWGIIGDGVRDNASRMAALRSWVAAKTAAGNTVKVVWPAGRYVYSQGPNWAIDGLTLQADGEVWLIHTGAGNASFLCDASAIPGGVRGIKISGDFRVYPNANSAQGVLIRSVHVSEIQIMSRGAGTGYAAIFISGCVCTEFRIRASSNDGGWVNTPTHCLYVTQHEPGGQTSYCTFINPILEGSPFGGFLDGAMGNTFIGGTMEATGDRGLHLTVNAIQNKFFSIDFEENLNYDVYCEGSNNEFLNCDTLKKILIAAGSNNKVVGGLHQAVETLAPASRTLLSSFQYNRVSGTAYPADAGSRTRFRDLTNIGTGRQHNAPPTVTQLTVGASPFNYTNNTGNDVSVHVIPGTMTGVSIVRAGQFLPTSTSYGNYLLSPGDGIQIEYSAIPAVFLMPR